MARQKKEIAPEAQTMDLVKKKKDENLSLVNQLFSKLGILGAEYDFFLFKQTAINLIGMHETTAVAFGAVLLAIKEHEPHGNFLNMLKEINVHPRKAQFYMNYFRRYGKYDHLSHLGRSKLDIFEAFSDEELKKLNDGGEVNGLTLDAIDELPAKELRLLLRATEEKLENQRTRYTKDTGKLKDEVDRLKEFENFGCELTKKEKAEKAICGKLEDLRKKLYTAIQLARFHFGDALSIIATARQLEGVTFPMLEKWAKSEYEEIAGFNALFEQLDDELNYISVDKGDGERA
jgi:hypothetical protein